MKKIKIKGWEYWDDKYKVQELEKIPKIKWARMWCEMNHWGFPKELDHLKPQWWDDEFTLELRGRKYKFLYPLLMHIKNILGERWLLREANKDSKTEEEFNEWWIKNRIEFK